MTGLEGILGLKLITAIPRLIEPHGPVLIMDTITTLVGFKDKSESLIVPQARVEKGDLSWSMLMEVCSSSTSADVVDAVAVGLYELGRNIPLTIWGNCPPKGLL